MDEKTRQEWADSLIGGNIPDKENFTKEEVKILCQTLLAWCGLQMENVSDELDKSDEEIDDFLNEVEFKNIKEAYSDTIQYYHDQIISLKEFIINHLD